MNSITASWCSLILLMAWIGIAVPAGAADLKVMTTGLGDGSVSGSGITCGPNGGTCNLTSTAAVTLSATPAAGSSFAGWEGDCSGTSPSCNVPMTSDASVRAKFTLGFTIPPITDFTPEGLNAYLVANPNVNTPARFVAALPTAFKQNWIMMSRSESLQTGVAAFPRFLLPSADARFIFTFGLATHSAYPGAHPAAIEYMQWDEGQKNFRFHEIVLSPIPALSNTVPPPRVSRVVVEPRSRGVSIDDARCFQCHSTRNVLSRSGVPGTTGIPAGSVAWKNKPNWDTYDSWGGMLPFNRDRIYKGSVEAAAFRKIFNLWTWRDNHAVRALIEQLELQPSSVTVPPGHMITRQNGGPNDGHITFGFDGAPPLVLTEPPISGSSTATIAYSFDGRAGTSGTTVQRGGDFVTLHHSVAPASDEGRGVDLFDLLGGFDGNLNQRRIADEINGHRFATGSVPIDVRPVALAITKGCLTLATLPSLTVDRAWFDARNGMTINQLVADTERRAGAPESRAESLPRKKADIQKLNLDRTGDPYLVLPENGLIQQYGAATSDTTTTTVGRLRQEVFRRPNDLGDPDSTVMGGFFVDRELYGLDTERIALYRYFLEPLGVSVDKWSMGVRGRSRTYTFADIFSTYISTFRSEIQASLTTDPVAGLTPPFDCAPLIAAVNTTLAPSALPAANAVPTYTDVQRIFNKSCIECHGGLGYPPFDVIFDADYLDFSEDETSATARLNRSWTHATTFTSTNPATSYLFQRITEGQEKCPDSTASPAPLMPCGGPALSQADIETIRRWIAGPPSRPGSVGDPHIRTVDGTNYDFQSAGEFVLLRGEGIEVQVRQTAVETERPLGPNAHTGLSSCVSINTAAAFRIGPHRITYQPNLSGEPDPRGLQLRIDGKLTTVSERGVALSSGGRIRSTTAPGGIQIEYPGGADVIVTPGWWDHHQLWYLNVDVRHARATEGVMGAIAPRNWLPALPDGTFLGPRPADLRRRYDDLYVRFADAWRVDDGTSLFDYAPGTSTDTFTLASWPGFEPQTCRLPPSRQNPARPPIEPLPLEVARQHCAPLVEQDRRVNCEQDVMVTGEPGFARTYLLTEGIVLNPRPVAPALLSPEKNKHDLATTVSFTWNKTTDANDDRLTYLQCVWAAGETLTFEHCQPMPLHMTMLDGYDQKLLWLILAIVLVLLILLFIRFRRARIIVGLLVLVVLVAAVVVFRFGHATRLSNTVSGLKPGQTYFWKVIAQDGNGGTTESETRRFATKK